MSQQPIPVEEESPQEVKTWGCYEKCVFCNQTTNRWHIESNTPVCAPCAGSHTLEQLYPAKEKSWQAFRGHA